MHIMKIKLILSVHISAKQKQCRRANFFSARFFAIQTLWDSTFPYFVQQTGNNAAIAVVAAAVIVVWVSVESHHSECNRDYQH